MEVALFSLLRSKFLACDDLCGRRNFGYAISWSQLEGCLGFEREEVDGADIDRAGVRIPMLC